MMPRIRAALLLPLLMACLCILTACAGGGKVDPLTSSGRALIGEQMEGPGAQSRIIPWDGLVLEERVSFVLNSREDQEVAGQTPGLSAAMARLRARQEALDRIADRLGALQAAEPPPGEQVNLLVREFAKVQPQVDAAVREALSDGWTEDLSISQTGDARITLTLPLKEVAEVVLEQGGGFSPDSEIGSRLSARRTAQRESARKAMDDLYSKALELDAGRGLKVEDWILRQPVNANRLRGYLNNARVLRSEEVAEGDQKYWKMELEFDPSQMMEEVRDDVDSLKAERIREYLDQKAKEGEAAKEAERKAREAEGNQTPPPGNSTSSSSSRRAPS